MSQLQKLLDAAADGIAPPLEIDLATWSEQNVRLSSEDSAVRGPFRAWPFQVEPMSVMSPSHPCEKVVLKCGSQTMKTRLLLNLLGYVIAADPGPALVIEPTQDDAESLSKDRLDPMIRDTPALRGKISEAKSRDAGNTIFHKKFTGGHVTIAYATSPSKLAMRPIRYLLFDEVSRYVVSAGKEGDPVRIGEKRTTTFWNRKIVYASSPGIDGACRISEIFDYSDQREWFVPCPFCGHEQVLLWPGIKWSNDGLPIKCRRKVGDSFAANEQLVPATDPHYLCSACECLIPHRMKTEMNERGRWIAQNPAGKYPGFHISQLYSPVRSWADIVDEWLEIQGKPEQIKVFVNTVQAETYKEMGEAPDWEKLQARAEDYELSTAPNGVLFVTAGVDVQKDRIEITFWGWGRGKQRWVIDHQVLVGNTSRPEVYERLTEATQRTFRHECGADMAVARLGIDSGYATTEVYAWARKQGPGRVLVLKGQDSGVALLGLPSSVDVVTRDGKKVRRGVKVWPLNVSMAKSELYGQLRQERPPAGEPFPPGWVHTARMDEEWFRQLTAEQWVVRVVKGYRKGEWVKVRERNEALDTANYARAAAADVGIDRNAHNERWWKSLEASLGVKAELAETAIAQPELQPSLTVPAPGSRVVARKVIRSNFMDS